MLPDRRDFLKRVACLTGLGLTAAPGSVAAEGPHSAAPPDAEGVLVDLSLCIGCRLCEHACKRANGFDSGPVESYDDQSVFQTPRRPEPKAPTVINAYPDPGAEGGQVFVKSNCLHCNHPACVSACIVGALQKQGNGAVVYDAWKCIGCRYCMVACPFQIPTYDYDDAFTPEVRKCEMCKDRLAEGGKPECVAACPREAMVYGRREELLALARQRIADNPGHYVDHIYGEHEVGGTSWLYISPVPFEQAGFLKLPDEAPPVLTEKIQHSVFKLGLPPLVLYGALGLVMSATHSRKDHSTGHGSVKLFDEGAASAPGPRKSAPDRHAPASHHHDDHAPAPVRHKFLTPGVSVLLILALTGLFFAIKRFVFGLGSTTNLDQQYPWGLWIGVDVAAGVALAAGGFTTAFLAEILYRDKYHAVVRPALLTAMLGYTFVVIGLQADLGRYYNVWHPIFMWQGNSALFEVGMCVMCYLNVLYLEFAPILCERLMTLHRFPRIKRLATLVNGKLARVMSLLVIAGCVLSCLHQSSLGTLMLIAPTKLHPLWWSPWLPLLFLLSAIAVGFPMVIWESLLASRSLKLKAEMEILGPLGRFIPWTLGAYLTLKIFDMVWRGTYVHLMEVSIQSVAWILEVLLGVIVPMVMMALPAVRRSPGLLWTAASLVVGGVLLNRVNVFLIGYQPPYAEKLYVPSFGEFAVTIGLIATLMLVYRLAVILLPVISQPRTKALVT